MNDLLLAADRKAQAKQPEAAIAALDDALRIAREIRRERNAVLHDATAVWYKTWLPRVAQANGRTFFHELDDVKDHLPDRTIGMEYLIYREVNLPMGTWVGKIQAARDEYAKAHNLAAHSAALNWDSLE